MDRPESQKLPKHRIVVLVLLIFAVLACYFTVMFNLQIVHGAEYRSQSVSQIVRTTTVEAARGNITDRNGNLIVGNQQPWKGRPRAPCLAPPQAFCATSPATAFFPEYTPSPFSASLCLSPLLPNTGSCAMCSAALFTP